MLSRRRFLTALAGAPLAACSTNPSASLDPSAVDAAVDAFAGLPSPDQILLGGRPEGRPDLARQTVPYSGTEPPGTVVVRTSERRLYFVLGDGKAIRYPVGVGRAGKQWSGPAHIESKHVRPAWSPPAEVRADNPRLPEVIPGGVPGNPMGERALVLQDEYAIHGTNRPQSVGTFATYGCIRMFNEDIIDLFDRVSVGTEVVVTR